MKIALCFSGNIRDINETKEFWNDLIKKYDIDVYASFWDVENEKVGDTLNNFLKIYTPKKYEVEQYEVFKNSTQNIASMNIKCPDSLPSFFKHTTKIFGQLPMWYKIWRCNLLTKQLGIEYDLVIRARTDTVLDENFEIVKNNMLNVPMGVHSSSFKNSDGINDCFAYAIPKVMDYYSFLYLQIMEYLKAGHYLFTPEHFLAVHFSKVHIQIRRFANYMMITRVSKGGSHELYNGFVKSPMETIEWSDDKEFIPDPFGNFKKEIKDDFIV